MAWASVNGIELYYELHGEGDTIVFAHGADGNHLSWWQQVSIFRERYRCLTFDQRGFGSSRDVKNGAGADYFADDLRGLLDELDIDKAYLVAQSMGGRSCIGFAAAFPERVKALVMADTVSGISDAGLQEDLRALREAWTQANPLGGAYGPKFSSEQPELAFLCDSIRALNPPRPQAQPGQPLSHERYAASAEKLASLDVPVLFIVGTDDVLVTPPVMHAAAKLIPHARVEEVTGCGHSVYFENSMAFNRLIAGFFDAVERGIWDISQANLTPSARNQWDRLKGGGFDPFALICSCGKSFVAPRNADGVLQDIWLSDHYGLPGHEIKVFEG